MSALPESTSDIAIGLLTKAVDVPRAIVWARDLWEAGRDDEPVVALALLSEDDWQEATRLLPLAMAAVGLDNTPAKYRWIERHLLRNYLDEILAEGDLVDAGYQIWARLLDIDPENPFSIYNWIGDMVSINTSGGDLHSMPPREARSLVRNALVEDGAFSRAGIEPPAT
jgi:hypothetical protein